MFDWIQNIADWFVFDALGLKAGNHLAEALNFFIYDTVKILILLFVVIFFMGIVNSYFPIDKVKNFLSRNKLYKLEYLMASLFGVVTPFCSCSSVPLFIGFVRGGIPLGVTFSFLITSPLVNEVAIGLFVGLFGVKNNCNIRSKWHIVRHGLRFHSSKFKIRTLFNPMGKRGFSKCPKRTGCISRRETNFYTASPCYLVRS